MESPSQPHALSRASTSRLTKASKSELGEHEVQWPTENTAPASDSSTQAARAKRIRSLYIKPKALTKRQAVASVINESIQALTHPDTPAEELLHFADALCSRMSTASKKTTERALQEFLQAFDKSPQLSKIIFAGLIYAFGDQLMRTDLAIKLKALPAESPERILIDICTEIQTHGIPSIEHARALLAPVMDLPAEAQELFLAGAHALIKNIHPPKFYHLAAALLEEPRLLHLPNAPESFSSDLALACYNALQSPSLVQNDDQATIAQEGLEAFFDNAHEGHHIMFMKSVEQDARVKKLPSQHLYSIFLEHPAALELEHYAPQAYEQILEYTQDLPHLKTSSRELKKQAAISLIKYCEFKGIPNTFPIYKDAQQSVHRHYSDQRARQLHPPAPKRVSVHSTGTDIRADRHPDRPRATSPSPLKSPHE